MKITFFSNYLTHHQLPFCLSLVAMEDVDFSFVTNEPLPSERISLGYEDMNDKYPFVLCTYKGEEYVKQAQMLADTSDIVIAGSNSMKYMKNRLKQRKLTFRYTERIMKIQYHGLRYLKFAWAQRRIHAHYPSMYLLAASAFAPSDYKKLGLFVDKAYRWGYFPEVKKYQNIDVIIKNKCPASILWTARLIDWKHPELPIQVAKRLKEEGYNFAMNLIGNGEMEAFLHKIISDYGLQDRVHMLGAMSPSVVREYMEKSDIFMFTSDRNEGWGAVLNESMNSACAVVASNAIGSVPFLVEHEKNGLIYEDGNFEALYSSVKRLLNSRKLCNELGKNAYQTMTELWNAETAAKRLITLSGVLSNGTGEEDTLYESGPCSKAKII